MKVIGVGSMSAEEINHEVERGGKFVIYQYCISILILTFKRSSSIHFIKAGESGFGRGIRFTFVSLVAGWWGIPWGPVYTIESIITNSRGGKDVTKQVTPTLLVQLLCRRWNWWYVAHGPLGDIPDLIGNHATAPASAAWVTCARPGRHRPPAG